MWASARRAGWREEPWPDNCKTHTGLGTAVQRPCLPGSAVLLVVDEDSVLRFSSFLVE